MAVFANIFLVDIFFGIEPGATITALVMLGCLLAVITPHSKRLWAAVMLTSPVPNHGARRMVAMVLLLMFGWGLTWWAANYNNRVPTPIDGTWVVVPDHSQQSVSWERAFFERNRAHMVVLRASDGKDKRHHFEVDGQGVVRIWQTWLTKGDLIMEGSVDATGQLVLEDRKDQHSGRVVLRREKSAL